jgi:hypothetical protein
MKSMLLSFFSCAWISLFSQTPVTVAAFPSIGDTIRTSVDTNALVAVLNPGGPNNWAFGLLESHRSGNLVYQAASVGNEFGSFPDAQMVTIAANGSETYYTKTATRFLTLGYAGPDPANLGLNVIARFQPPLVNQRAPMMFFDVNQSTSNLSLAFSIADLPDSLLMIPAGIDSIRLRFKQDRLDVVDAYGSINIPGETQTVLREKRTEISETLIDVYSGFLGWFELPIGGIGGGGGIPAGLLGVDTSVSYHFFSNQVKEQVAVVDVDPNTLSPQRVTFKSNQTSAVKPEPEFTLAASVFAYPNPAVDEVSFECRNLPSGSYSLKIFNLLGKTVWKQDYQIAGSKSIKVDLDQMRKGTYLYSLTDKNGTIIGTKRLVIIKP